MGGRMVDMDDEARLSIGGLDTIPSPEYMYEVGRHWTLSGHDPMLAATPYGLRLAIKLYEALPAMSEQSPEDWGGEW